MFWDSSDNLDRSIGVNFDWYSIKFAYRHTAKEVKNWYKESKLKITNFNEIESEINVTGTKINLILIFKPNLINLFYWLVSY